MSLRFSVPAVEDALVDALTARPALAGVYVSDGLGAEQPEEDQRVIVIRSRDLQLVEATRQGGQTEEYDLYVLSSVYWPDSTADTPAESDRRAAKARKWELLDELRNLLADDPELGGAAKKAAAVGVPDATTTRTSDGWLSEGIAVVHVRATSG